MSEIDDLRAIRAVCLILAELRLATAKHGCGFNSAHEGYAVILEELDELWHEIKGHAPDKLERLRDEAVQVGAMAVRFLIDMGLME